MKFLTINGKIQINSEGKPITVPDTFSGHLIKLGSNFLETSDGILIGKVSSGSSSSEGWTVPTGCSYTCTNNTVYSAGDTIPSSYEPQAGDTFVDSDYTYKYKSYYSSDNVEYDDDTEELICDGWTIDDGAVGTTGWGVIVHDTRKTSYNNPLSLIANKPITYMGDTYRDCESLVSAPVIPNSTISLSYAFSGCCALTSAPTIPESVKDLSYTFSDCCALTSAPTIPENVQWMVKTFFACDSLSGTITINANPEDYEDCFNYCGLDEDCAIVLEGDSEILYYLAETGGPYVTTEQEAPEEEEEEEET